MVKALGAEIKRFWNDEEYVFPKGDVEHDGGELDVDELADTEKYELSQENFGWFNYTDVDSSISFAAAFKDWQKRQTHVNLLLEVPKEKEEYVLTWLRTITPAIKIIK